MGALLAVVLAAFAPQDKKEQEPIPGKYRVNVRGANFLEEASSLAEPVRKAVHGEEVEVVAFTKNGKQTWAKCHLREGKTAFISARSLLGNKEFETQAEGSSEAGAAAAEGYRGSRFDPATEEKYRTEKNLGPAYQQVDAWCGRPEEKNAKTGAVSPALPGKPVWRNDRGAMLRILREFRKDGKLGEFAGDGR